MTAREKLAKLLCKAHNAVTEAELENDDMSYADALEIEADVLIAHGVVISKMETTTQGWISVKDRLPDDYEKVLTCDRKGNIHVMAHHHDFIAPFGITKHDFRYFPVTHWMPLPEPPKEE